MVIVAGPPQSGWLVGVGFSLDATCGVLPADCVPVIAWVKTEPGSVDPASSSETGTYVPEDEVFVGSSRLGPSGRFQRELSANVVMAPPRITMIKMIPRRLCLFTLHFP